jgi:pimeloyl-ACP methyl ester carboxylesterase
MGAVTLARKHVLAPTYRPEEELTLVADDGVPLHAVRLAGPPDATATVVLVHGFAHSCRTPRIHGFAHLLARSVHVVVPDLRGHGRSGGACTLGVDEPRDVAAAVDAAPPGLPVVTVGVSLGGAAALLHAGSYGGVAGVVGVSSPAWGAWDTRATRRVRWYATARAGRAVLSTVLRTRIADRCEDLPDARHLAAAIAPAFTLVVADPADHYFPVEHPLSIYEWAREPKDLWLLPGTGHGTELLRPSFAARLLAHVGERLSTPSGPAN